MRLGNRCNRREIELLITNRTFWCIIHRLLCCIDGSWLRSFKSGWFDIYVFFWGFGRWRNREGVLGRVGEAGGVWEYGGRWNPWRGQKRGQNWCWFALTHPTRLHLEVKLFFWSVKFHPITSPVFRVGADCWIDCIASEPVASTKQIISIVISINSIKITAVARSEFREIWPRLRGIGCVTFRPTKRPTQRSASDGGARPTTMLLSLSQPVSQTVFATHPGPPCTILHTTWFLGFCFH